MRNELDELRKQKKQIEARIKELKSKAIIKGIVKIDTEHYPTQTPERHYLAIHSKQYRSRVERWVSVYSAPTQAEVVDAIPQIIADLQELYDQCKEDDGNVRG